MKMLRNDGELAYVYQRKTIKPGHYAEIDDGSAPMLVARWNFTEIERKQTPAKPKAVQKKKPIRASEDRI